MDKTDPLGTSISPEKTINKFLSKFRKVSLNFKTLPVGTKKLLSLGMVVALLVALPIVVMTVVTSRTFFFNRAATGEPPGAVRLIPYIGSEDAPFKILFININNSPYFDQNVDSVINNKFKTISPYAENFNLITFYKASLTLIPIDDYCHTLPITGSSGYECDPYKIINSLKSIYSNYNEYDYVNVALVETNHGGSSGTVITIGVAPGFDQITSNRLTEKTVIHEITHYFGLLDYVIGQINNDGSPNRYWDPVLVKRFYNIDSAGCSKWCKSYKPVSEYNKSVSSACLNFNNKESCISFNRVDVCDGDNCCVWSDTPFEYFNKKCVPWKGSEDIGRDCIENTGCYFGGAYSHDVWRPVDRIDTTIMGDGYGVLDKVSEQHVESVFKCCMNSEYSSSLTSTLDCESFKSNYQNFLQNTSVVKIGLCVRSNPTNTPEPRPNTPTPTPRTPTPTPKTPSPTPRTPTPKTPNPTPRTPLPWTPYPTPNLSIKPVISTSALPTGRVKRYYSASISGYEKISNARLNMGILGLPKGLSTTCVTGNNIGGSMTTISCYIKGTPLSWGIYRIPVTLYDSRQQSISKTFSLIIYPF